MAGLLWGNVYYQDHFAGTIRQEPGERVSFAYDESYLQAGHPAIAHTLPPQPEPCISQSGLLPFFDNLVAEGWLKDAQTRLLGKRHATRFELLLAFGQDLAGAVSVIDPKPQERGIIRSDDLMESAVMAGRASLSDIQPKLALTLRDGKLYPARAHELSTHTAKFSSPLHEDLAHNEYLTTLALGKLLPNDEVVDLRMGKIAGFNHPALIIKRFDRAADGGRIHFEKFSQLLGLPAEAKYDGSHKSMAHFIRQTPACLPVETYRLYLRILAGLLLGNTDMHLKNFAMFHTDAGLRLTPVYNSVCAALYGHRTTALSIGKATHAAIVGLKARALVRLGEEFGLSSEAIAMAATQLQKRLEAAKDTVAEKRPRLGAAGLQNTIIKFMEKRWNRTFALIGKALSKKQ